MFDVLYSMRPAIEQRDALLRYLQDPIEIVNDPLAWWERNSEHYDSRLARMAKDYLSIPGKYPLFHLMLAL